nr:TrkA C-terminal domain-containing protein [Rhabdothermincola salaria]
MLLSGLVVTGHDAAAPAVHDEPVQVVTLELAADSPALGRVPDELADEGRARVLAVIRDDTPELVEDDPSRALRVGDRLVVAARPEELDAVRHRLGAR